MVVHLSRDDLLARELKHQLGNCVEVHLLKPFGSPHPGGDDIAHLVQHKGGKEWRPLHGRPHLALLVFGNPL